MSPLVVIVVLGAALLHSSWHAMIKNSEDRIVGLAGMNVVSAGVALFGIPFVAVPKPGVWVVLAGSVVLHNAYKIALARLYTVGDLGHSFPLARGMSPLAATLLAAVFLGEWPNSTHLAGIVVISAGLLWLALEGRGITGNVRVLVIAALTGLAVAGYSVADGFGVRLSRDWFAYTVWLIVLDGGSFIIYSRWHTGNAFWSTLALKSRTVLISGSLGVISFSAFLWALGNALVGGVTALREVSVLFASVIGVIALKERLSVARIAGAALVTAGVALLSLT